MYCYLLPFIGLMSECFGNDAKSQFCPNPSIFSTFVPSPKTYSTFNFPSKTLRCGISCLITSSSCYTKASDIKKSTIQRQGSHVLISIELNMAAEVSIFVAICYFVVDVNILKYIAIDHCLISELVSNFSV